MNALRAAIVFCLLSAAPSVHAQQEPCGLRTMTESAAPVYPPIAKAAHVNGNVITLVSFKTTGEVGEVTVVSGPEMLRKAAVDYIRSWRANPYTGPRTCPIVINFAPQRPASRKDPPLVVRTDLQHVTLNAFYVIQPMTQASNPPPPAAR
jgi:hypothetical protein